MGLFNLMPLQEFLKVVTPLTSCSEVGLLVFSKNMMDKTGEDKIYILCIYRSRKKEREIRAKTNTTFLFRTSMNILCLEIFFFPH